MEAAEAEAEAAGADVAPDDWVPIVPQSPSSSGTPQPTQSDVDIHTTTDNLAPLTAAATVTDPSSTLSPPPTLSSLEPASTETPVVSKMSRRERILHLARQNAQTPFPEQLQPVAEVEAEKVKESEQEVKERSIRERLWRLVGGNY